MNFDQFCSQLIATSDSRKARRSRWAKAASPQLLTLACLLVGSALLGCSASASDSESVSTTDRRLVVATPGLYGTGTIEACWHTSSSQPLTYARKMVVQEAVTRAWENVSGVSFVGWTDCSDSPVTGTKVAVVARPSCWVDDNGETQCGPAGMARVGGQSGNNWVGLDLDLNDATLAAVAIHEFGHTLSYYHEQVDSRTPPSCTLSDNGDLRSAPADGVTVADWDPDSVMNYCNPNWVNGELSDIDIAGTQKYNGLAAPKTGDFEGSGTTSFVVQTPDGIRLVAYANDAPVVTAAANYGTTIEGGWIFSRTDKVEAVADFSGDGKADILLRNNWGWGILTKSTGGKFKALTGTQNGVAMEGGWVAGYKDSFIGVGDVDGNGTADMVVQSTWGLGVWSIKNNKFSTLSATPWGTNLNGWTTSYSDLSFGLADLDGDRYPDLMIRNKSGLGILSHRNSSQFRLVAKANHNSSQNGGWYFHETDLLQVANNVTGANRASLVVRSDWGIGVLELSAGALTTKAYAQHGGSIGGWALQSSDRVFASADMNGDGRDELLIRSGWGLGVLSTSGSNMTLVAATGHGSVLNGWKLGELDRIVAPGRYTSSAGSALIRSGWGFGRLAMPMVNGKYELTVRGGRAYGTNLDGFAFSAMDVIPYR